MLIKGAVYVQESISSRVTKCATFGFKTEVQKCHFNQGEKRYIYCNVHNHREIDVPQLMCCNTNTPNV